MLEAMTVVAIVDSGLNLKHRDITDHLWVNAKEIPSNGVDDDGNGVIDDVHGFDTFDTAGLKSSLANSGDPQGHGTHVAGIVTTLAPKAEIMPIRMLDANGNGLLSDALFGWSYALDNGAKVINNSFGIVGSATSEFSFMEEALRIGREKHGAVFIAAAGNTSNNNDVIPCTPANVPGMISVGATSWTGDVASFSNYGRKSVDLFAPGENILSADAFSLTNRSRKSGTSQAAPMVAAFAANVLAKKPKSKPAFVERQLFKQLESSSELANKSQTGGELADKHTKKVTHAASSRQARRLERTASSSLVNFGRFIGVVDESNGMTQQDVTDQLMCSNMRFVEEVKWPFDNIAVFFLDQSSNKALQNQKNFRRSQRVLDTPWQLEKNIKRIKKMGLFKEVEWDAYVTQLSSEDSSFLNIEAPWNTDLIDAQPSEF